MKLLRSDHEEVRAALKAVADSTATESAPEHLEAELLRAFTSRKKVPTHSRLCASVPLVVSSRTHLRASVSLVVSFALVAGAAIWMSRYAPPAVTPVEVAASIGFQLPAPAITEPPAYARKVVAQHPAAAEPKEVVTGFLPLGYSGPAPEAYQVVRVKMNRSALAQFGLPINIERSDEPLDADLLIGDDGMPRALRFINLVSTTSQSSQDWRKP